MKTIQYIKMENHRTIEDIAYLIEQANKRGENKPIVFLGAGASVSAGIPLVGNIIDDILELHKDKPSIKRLSEEHKKDYYKLMSALSAQERRNLFSGYINNDKVKLNVTHIYLAQMLKEKLIDYVLTVNFDDLMLKACAMFNFIPPVYDVSILNDFTTTTFLEKSVTYLHGQHHGQWLLNAEGELTKVKESIPKIFERICNNRTWIVVGYSGEDELVNEIARIGSFENELYWIGYNESPLSEQVKEKLFSNSRTNAYHIKGYDSDSFFLKLHSELNLKTPEIFNKPFSFLDKMMAQVTDILVDEKNEHKSLFDNIRNRMEISKEQVLEAIETIENRDDENELIQEIIETTLKKDFSEEIAQKLRNQIKDEYTNASKALGHFYNSWGSFLLQQAENEKDDNKLEQSFKIIEQALELNPEDVSILNNWATILSELALVRKEKELYIKSLSIFEKASRLDPKNAVIYNNWGNVLIKGAKQENSKELYQESFEKYKKSSELSPLNSNVYFNWGTSLLELAIMEEDKDLYEESFKKFEQSLKLNPKNSGILNNWGNALTGLAEQENDKDLYKESFKKFEQSSILNPENGSVLYNWGGAICALAQLNEDKDLFKEGFKKFEQSLKLNPNDRKLFTNWASGLLNYSYLLDNENGKNILQKAKEVAEKAFSMDGDAYNLACVYSLLDEKEEALKYLKKVLKNKQIAIGHIDKDRDWDKYKEDEDFTNLLNEYKN